MKLPAVYHDLNPRQRRDVRSAYVKVQKGLCWYCATRLKDSPAQFVLNYQVDISLFPTGFFTWPVHLHHDRVTGLTVGAVHARCNAVSWMKDEVPVLQQLAKEISGASITTK